VCCPGDLNALALVGIIFIVSVQIETNGCLSDHVVMVNAFKYVFNGAACFILRLNTFGIMRKKEYIKYLSF